MAEDRITTALGDDIVRILNVPMVRKREGWYLDIVKCEQVRTNVLSVTFEVSIRDAQYVKHPSDEVWEALRAFLISHVRGWLYDYEAGGRIYGH